MKILQISFHTSPFGNIGKFDSGGLNVYVQQISKQLSKNHNVTVVTAEKAESFKNGNLEFYSLNMFNPGLSTEDKEIHLKSFTEQLEKTIDLNSFDIVHAHYWTDFPPRSYLYLSVPLRKSKKDLPLSIKPWIIRSFKTIPGFIELNSLSLLEL